jgi:hypothetical protein
MALNGVCVAQSSIFCVVLYRSLFVLLALSYGDYSSHLVLLYVFEYVLSFEPSFGSFGQAVSEEKIFKNQPIRNKNCLWRPCMLMDRDKMSNRIYGSPLL